MDTFTAIESRRAVKHYDPDHKLTEPEIDRLLNSALLAPTAFNIQNWRFVVVRDNVLRKEIRAAAWNQAQVTEASLLIILCADLKSWEKQPERYCGATRRKKSVITFCLRSTIITVVRSKSSATKPCVPAALLRKH